MSNINKLEAAIDSMAALTPATSPWVHKAVQRSMAENVAATGLPYTLPAKMSAPQGLLKEDLQVFVNGFIMTNMDVVEDECGGLPDDLGAFVDKVWACLDMNLHSDEKLVQIITAAATRALKPVHP